MYNLQRIRYHRLLHDIEVQLSLVMAGDSYDFSPPGFASSPSSPHPLSSSATNGSAGTSGHSLNGVVGSGGGITASATASSRSPAAVALGRRQQILAGGGPMLKSSASTPSLRSRESELVTMARSGTPDNTGGNVRVVVRVRGFLPRGMSYAWASLRSSYYSTER